MPESKKKSWYTLKNEATGPAQLYIHGYIGDWDIEAIDLIRSLQAIGEQDIVMRVQSGGGSIYEGLAMYNAIKAHKGKTTGIVDGLAASIASYFLMACDEVQMPENASLMIHNPSVSAWGEEEEIESALTQLKNSKATIAEAYAEKSGKTLDDVLAAMKQETWFTAQQALEWGLIDQVIDPVDLTNKFTEADIQGFNKFKHTPDSLLNVAKTDQGSESPAASATSHTQTESQVSDMPIDTNENDQTTQLQNAVKAENQRQADIRALCSRHKVTDELMNQFLADMNCTVENASAQILQNMSSRQDEIRNLCTMHKISDELTNQLVNDPTCSLENASAKILEVLGGASAAGQSPNNITSTQVRADNGNHVKDELQNALNARCGVGELEKDNSFGHESLLNMARASLGVNVRSAMTKDELVNRAFNSEDFGEIITESVRTVMRAEREAIAPLWRELANTENLPDFRERELVMINDAPDLMGVGEDGEYKAATLKGSGERIQLATFGREIKFTRQAIINDEIGLIAKVPRKFMRSGYRLSDKLMFNAILAGKMADDEPVFITGTKWGNLVEGIASGDYPALIMALHKIFATATTVPLDGTAGGGDALDLRGEILIANPDHASMLEAVLNTASKPDTFNPAYKKFSKVIETARTADVNGAIALTAKDFDCVLMGFLDGQQDPWLETGDGWTSDGAKFRITYDVTSKVVDRRGIAKATFATAAKK